MISENMKSLRMKEGISNNQLAFEIEDKTGVKINCRTLGHYECKRFEPSLSKVIAIADYYGISIDELVRAKKY